MVRSFRFGILAACCLLILIGCTETSRTVESITVAAPSKPLILTSPFGPHVFGHSTARAVIDNARCLGLANVDWTTGMIIVEGTGYLPDRALSPAQRDLAAKRAARVVAIHNAVRVAKWLVADPDQTLVDVHGVGSDRLRAVVSNFTETAEPQKFTAPDGRVGYKMKVSVPLWGVRGLGGATFDAYHAWVKWEKKSKGRYKLVAFGSEGVSTIECIVIDARGLPLRPVLWGEIADPTGKIVYDYQTSGGERTIYYARSVAGTLLLEYSGGVASRPATGEALVVKRVVIKAKSVAGKKGGRVVIKQRDAEMLATTPQYARLLAQGRVIVLTDAKPR